MTRPGLLKNGTSGRPPIWGRGPGQARQGPGARGSEIGDGRGAGRQQRQASRPGGQVPGARGGVSPGPAVASAPAADRGGRATLAQSRAGPVAGRSRPRRLPGKRQDVPSSCHEGRVAGSGRFGSGLGGGPQAAAPEVPPAEEEALSHAHGGPAPAGGTRPRPPQAPPRPGAARPLGLVPGARVGLPWIDRRPDVPCRAWREDFNQALHGFRRGASFWGEAPKVRAAGTWPAES